MPSRFLWLASLASQARRVIQIISPLLNTHFCQFSAAANAHAKTLELHVLIYPSTLLHRMCWCMRRSYHYSLLLYVVCTSMPANLLVSMEFSALCGVCRSERFHGTTYYAVMSDSATTNVLGCAEGLSLSCNRQGLSVQTNYWLRGDRD